MRAGRGDFKCAFSTVLSADVGEIAVNEFVERVDVGCAGLVTPLRAVTKNDGDGRMQRVDRVEFDAVDERRFVAIAFGNDQLGKPGVARPQDHRQNAVDGLQGAVERQFAQRDELLQC